MGTQYWDIPVLHSTLALLATLCGSAIGATLVVQLVVLASVSR